MRLTNRLLQHTARLTLFTRQNCSLCNNAKMVLSNVGKSRTFELQEIDVMQKGQEQWKAAYEFDAPVLHVQRVLHTYAKPDGATEPSKLFHRFESQDVEKLIDDAQGHA